MRRENVPRHVLFYFRRKKHLYICGDANKHFRKLTLRSLAKYFSSMNDYNEYKHRGESEEKLWQIHGWRVPIRLKIREKDILQLPS